MKFNFDEVIDRHGTNSMKWDATDELIRQWGMGDRVPQNAIFVSTADMDFRCPPCIKGSMQKILDYNLYGYYILDPKISSEYYDALTNWNQRRYNWKFSSEDIIYIDGTINAVAMAVKALTGPADSVMISPPVYSPFFNIITDMACRNLVKSHLISNDNYYTFDWDDLEKKAARPDVKAYLLCSPHNPTGRVWTDEELCRLYEICTRNGVILIADEIHGDLTRKDHPFHPIGSLVDGKNLVVCSGANKTFNIASLHASHIIVSNPELRKKIQAIMDWNAPNPYTIAATVSAYNNGEEWLEELRTYLDKNIDYAVDFLHKRMPRVKVRRPEGTYILWMDFSDYGLTASELNERLFAKAGIGVESGKDFDPDHGEGYIRMCLATPLSVVKEIFDRVETAFSDL